MSAAEGGKDLARKTAERMVEFLSRASKEIAEDSVEGRVSAGIVLSLGGFQAEAIKSFEQALAKDPQNTEALARATFAYLRAGHPDAAVEAAAQLVAADGNYRMTEITTGGQLGAYSILGLATLATSRKEAAREAFEQAFELFEEDSVAWAYLAQLRQKPAEIRVSGASAANPRFGALGRQVQRGGLDNMAVLAAASGARTRFVAVADHGRPLMADEGSILAEAQNSDAWLTDLSPR